MSESDICEVNVIYFKESGKYYTTELMTVDRDSMPWHMKPEMFRIKSMIAVITDGPWGYPYLFHPSDNS